MSKKGKRSIAAKAIIDEIDRELLIEQTGEDDSPYEFCVEWSGANFHFSMRDVKALFYGWYRKSRMKSGETIHCVDMFVKYTVDAETAKSEELDLSVDSIVYANDPRKAIKSLNADLCAAANKWLFTKLHGDFNTVDQLRRQAKQPTIHVKRIGTMDAIIMKLRECRDTAIRCGGTRIVQLTGDTGAVPINILINVTAQAMALKGEIPSLAMGGLMDRVLAGEPKVVKGGGERASGMTRNVPDDANVQALLEMLKTTKDKSQGRKIRATLRKMGHKGGSRHGTNGKAE